MVEEYDPNRFIMDRKFFQSDIWEDRVARDVWMWLLGAANWGGRHTMNGIWIDPGHVVTSKAIIARKTGFTERQVRTALAKLSDRGSINVRQLGRKGSDISIVKFKSYQLPLQTNDRQPVKHKSAEGISIDIPTTDSLAGDPPTSGEVGGGPPLVTGNGEFCPGSVQNLSKERPNVTSSAIPPDQNRPLTPEELADPDREAALREAYHRRRQAFIDSENRNGGPA